VWWATSRFERRKGGAAETCAARRGSLLLFRRRAALRLGVKAALLILLSATLYPAVFGLGESERNYGWCARTTHLRRRASLGVH